LAADESPSALTDGYSFNAFHSLLGIAGGIAEPTYAEPG
jgi:hypothetical protein